MPRQQQCTWPDPRAVRELLHSAAWLTFAYMFLLTLFELIELLRPKAARLRPKLYPPPVRATPSPATGALCPRCAANGRKKKRRCIIL